MAMKASSASPGGKNINRRQGSRALPPAKNSSGKLENNEGFLLPPAEPLTEELTQANPWAYARVPFCVDGETKPGRAAPRRRCPSAQEREEENSQRVKDYEAECREVAASIEKLAMEMQATASSGPTRPVANPAQLAQQQLELAGLKAKLEASQRLHQHFQEEASFWRGFQDDPVRLKAALFQQVLADRKSLLRLEQVAQVDEEAVAKLGELIQIALAQLAGLAVQGSNQAAQELATIALLSTRDTNHLATARPKRFRPIARQNLEWPVLCTSKATFPQTDPEQLLASLQLSKGTSFKNFSTSMWRIDDEAGAVAWQLWFYVANLRQKVRYFESGSKAEAWFSFSELERQAGQLEDFSIDTYSQWWELAKVFLLESYPRPWEAPALASIGTRKKVKRATATSGSPRASDQRRLFFDALRQKFKSFAGANRRGFTTST